MSEINLIESSDEGISDWGYSTASSITNVHQSILTLSHRSINRYIGRRTRRLKNSIWELASNVGFSADDEIPPPDVFVDIVNDNSHSILSQLFNDNELRTIWNRFIQLPEEQQRVLLEQCKIKPRMKHLKSFKLLLHALKDKSIQKEQIELQESKLLSFFNNQQDSMDDIGYVLKSKEFSKRVILMTICQHYNLSYTIADNDTIIVMANQKPAEVECCICDVLSKYENIL